VEEEAVVVATAGNLIKEIDNTFEVKRFKELSKIIKSNKEYMNLLDKLNSSTNIDDVISIRKELFKYDDIKEYINLEKEIRLFSRKLSNELSSIVEKHTC
jgi:RNA processing factor Prp31